MFNKWSWFGKVVIALGKNLWNVIDGQAVGGIGITVGFVHDLFAGELNVRRDINRFSLYHFPHDTFASSVMVIYGGDNRVANNIFLGQTDEPGEYV